MNNSQLDPRIREALDGEDRHDFDQLVKDPGPIALAVASFRAGPWWFTSGIWVFGVVVSALLVFCTLRFFAAPGIESQLTWGIAMLFCGLGLVIVKIGAWQQMQTQLLRREIKRLELRWLTAEGDSRRARS